MVRMLTSEIVLTVGNDLITALIGIGIGLIGFKLFRKPIYQAIMGDIVAIASDETNQARIKAAVEQYLISTGTAFLKYFHEHPEQFTPMLTGVMEDLAKAIPKEKVGQLAMDTIGASAGDIAGSGALIQYVPRKWRGPYAIASMLFGGAKEKVEEKATSAFG